MLRSSGDPPPPASPSRHWCRLTRALFMVVCGGAVNASSAATAVAAAAIGDASVRPGLTIALGLLAIGAALAAWHFAREKKVASRRAHTLLTRADCMVWEARVVRTNNDFAWSFTPHPSGLFRRIFPDLPPANPGSLWPQLRLDDLPEMDARAQAAMTSDAPGYQQEFRVRKDDQTLWLQEQVSIARTGPDEWHLIGVITDVTAWREKEADLHAKEARVHEILARADCLLWRATVTKDGEGRLQWGGFDMPTTGLYPRLFGKRDPSAGGKLWSFLKVPAIQEMNARSREAIFSGQRGYQQEFCAISETETIWLRERVSVEPDGPDRWNLVGVLVDVTAQHDAETALAAEKERLAVTLRAMSDGVITTDTAGLVQFVNAAAAALLGCAADSVVGQPVAKVCPLVASRTGVPVPLPVDQVAERDAIIDLPADAELEDGRGRRRRIEGCCAPIHAADGAVIGTVMVLRDITERARLEQEIQRASKLESIGVLAGGIAHDFNNILTAIVGNLNLALLDDDNVVERRHSLKEAERAALQARELTQQLLTFAKGGEPVRATVHLPEVMRQTAEFTVRGSRVRCEFNLAHDLWLLDADRGQISQVVQNLVLNAVQAMPAGGVVRLAARNFSTAGGSPTRLEPGDYVHFTVADTGVGIAPEHVVRVFDPYFSTKQQGSGLGLATVYSIVSRHRGRIDVQSELGGGSTFHVWIPALRQAQHVPTPASPPMADNLRGRVLVMDDEAAIRRLLNTLLQRAGLDVATASDGAEAVRMFRTARDEGKPFDLVIMDLTVPGGMGGLEALQHLHGIDPKLKAIVSSGYSSDPVLANFRTHGFRGRVAKPYEMAKLLEVVRDVLAE